ncbi:MAG: ADP-ribosyltransferase [Bacilli bacterium]
MEKTRYFVKNHFYPWKINLTPPQIIALKDYSGVLYKEINTDLLNNSASSSLHFNTIKLLDSSLTHTPPQNIKFFRSEKKLDSIEDILLTLEASMEIGKPYPNFISTSFNPNVALRHISIARLDFLPYTYTFFTLSASSKVKCGYLDEDLSSRNGTEDEILFGRSYVLKIKNFKLKDDFDDVIEIKGKIEFI